MMSSYQTFAQFYDFLTENVDYKVRSEFISNFFSEHGNGGNTVLDLACGTGSISKFLSEQGYSVTGIDLSEDMLVQAQSKGIKNAFFIKGDITDFSLPHKVDNCLCSLDSINHLKDIDYVQKCFICVNRALNDDGIFVFDVNTQYKHKYILGDETFVFDEDEFFLSWDNEYLGDDIVRIILDFFVYNGESYDRFTEEFCEKAYSIDELNESLNNTGFEIIGIYDELSLQPPRDDSERLYFVCKKVK